MQVYEIIENIKKLSAKDLKILLESVSPQTYFFSLALTHGLVYYCNIRKSHG